MSAASAKPVNLHLNSCTIPDNNPRVEPSRYATVRLFYRIKISESSGIDNPSSLSDKHKRAPRLI
jgi:hypothetical protein